MESGERTIRTSRLILRRWRDEDLAPYAALNADPRVMQHFPAVLSREFGIPSVVGTSVATERIATGDRLRVDGTAGTVAILERAAVRA